MAAYAWRGATRRGRAQTDLPAWGEARHRQGWRHLVVAAAGDVGRAWYAEGA